MYSKEAASGKFDDLEKGSAGQKAAAILAFLLSHGNEPPVIDQPESELVHVLKFGNGQVQLDCQGGLEEGNIREAICTIAEGGRKAFDKRYQRIRSKV